MSLSAPPDILVYKLSIYIWNRRSILAAKTVIGNRTLLFEMPEERSIDIDSQMDFEWVEYLLKKNQDGGRHV